MFRYPKTEEVIKLKRGRQVCIRTDVVLWRRRNRRFVKLKAKILEWATKRGWGATELAAWSSTPEPKLRNRTPKELWNPNSIKVLWDYVRKLT